MAKSAENRKKGTAEMTKDFDTRRLPCFGVGKGAKSDGEGAIFDNEGDRFFYRCNIFFCRLNILFFRLDIWGNSSGMKRSILAQITENLGQNGSK